MTTSLFTFIDLYRRQLETLSHLLNKGAEFAAARGVSEREMLNWRLIEDMHPLAFQAMVVINFATQWPARVAGVAGPAEITADLDVAGFQAAIAAAKTFLAGLTAEQIDGRADAPVTFKIGEGMEPTLPGERWLAVFATTNLYFHLSTAYGILRSKGAPIGKVDLFASGL